MPLTVRVLCAACLFLIMTAEASAYGGPGAAITLIGSLIGVGLAIFASLFYVIAWPLRRMLKKRKAAAQPAAQDSVAGEPAEAGPAAAGKMASGSAGTAPQAKGH